MSCRRALSILAQVAFVVLACVASGVSSGPADSRDESDAYLSHRDQPFLHTVNSLRASRTSPQQIQQWIEQYGPIITLTNGEDIHVIIGRHQVLSRGLKFMQMSTCARFRMYRKAAHSELRMKGMLIYDNDQTQYARNIVLDVLKEPESHQGHIKRFSATMTLRVIYGKTMPTYLNDSYILHLQRMAPIVQGALMPGAYKVDKYPFLKYVPGYTWELDSWANLEHEQSINNVR
ncbi:hypothetical protein BU15DRAFT_58981 [Melanogaster broomeanus]|nr:hypothetical protein BU15DRAFT_58981 [Melanogaster broomeanus]